MACGLDAGRFRNAQRCKPNKVGDKHIVLQEVAASALYGERIVPQFHYERMRNRAFPKIGVRLPKLLSECHMRLPPGSVC